MESGEVIVEYITKENLDDYPFLTEEFRKMLLDGVLENIKIERKVLPQENIQDKLKLEEYRLRRKRQRQKKRKQERDFKKSALMCEAEWEEHLDS